VWRLQACSRRAKPPRRLRPNGSAISDAPGEVQQARRTRKPSSSASACHSSRTSPAWRSRPPPHAPRVLRPRCELDPSASPSPGEQPRLRSLPVVTPMFGAGVPRAVVVVVAEVPLHPRQDRPSAASADAAAGLDQRRPDFAQVLVIIAVPSLASACNSCHSLYLLQTGVFSDWRGIRRTPTKKPVGRAQLDATASGTIAWQPDPRKESERKRAASAAAATIANPPKAIEPIAPAQKRTDAAVPASTIALR
jgi:hypothetical protein